MCSGGDLAEGGEESWGKVAKKFGLSEKISLYIIGNILQNKMLKSITLIFI
jgi:hypothetical protein